MALEDFEKDMTRCIRCSLCKFPPLEQIKSQRFSNVCPSVTRYNFHTYSGGGKQITGLALLHGRLEYSDELADVVYHCQMCGACDVSCKYCRDRETLEPMYELRARLINEGQLIPGHLPYIESLRKEDNMMLGKKADRGAWAEGLGIKHILTDPAPVLFHAGCRISYDEELQKLARTAASLLKLAGVDFAIAGPDETCCGGRAYEMGYQSELIKFAEHNLEMWKSNGVKTVVTACSDCYTAFKVDYYKMGYDYDVEILHITQYLERLLDEGKLKPIRAVPLTVTYHDPCHLGRKSEPHIRWQGVERKTMGQLVLHSPIKEYRRGTYGVYETPRNVLRSIPGLKLVEMERIKEYAWCCGAGGGVLEAYPDFAVWSALERIAEAKASGATALVTACPWCERNFNDALSETDDSFGIYDVVEIVAQACEGGS